MRFAARQTPMPTLRRIRRVLLGTLACSWCPALAGLICVSISLPATADQLARRGTLGAGLREPAAGRAGSEIVSIQPDSAAARAGLRVGDRVLRIDQTLLTDEIAQQTALAELRAGRRVALQVVTQDGSVSAREITPDEVPREQVPGLELEIPDRRSPMQGIAYARSSRDRQTLAPRCRRSSSSGGSVATRWKRPLDLVTDSPS